jgi:hypothetical protein
MKTSGRRPFLEIAPHAITADAFWDRGTVNFIELCLTVILTTLYHFARSVVAPGQTSSRSFIIRLLLLLFRHPLASLATNRMVSRFNFKSNSLTYILGDRSGGYRPFSGRVFTSSGAFTINRQIMVQKMKKKNIRAHAW